MRRTVELDPSHLARFACTPLKAIQELVWNALDADADAIEVELRRNALEGVEQIIVRDDGHGMSFGELDDAFLRLGGSWKRLAGGTRGKARALHGRAGEGRYRAAT